MELAARNEALAKLLEQKVGLRGGDFAAKVARAGRRLPRHLRGEAAYLAEAEQMLAAPKLASQIDWARAERAAADLERYLKGIDPWHRRRRLLADWVAANALNLLIVAGLVAALLAWRGLL